jgi:hypothetical protein
MDLAETPISSKFKIYLKFSLLSSTHGGFATGGKLQEYRVAFKNSLRVHEPSDYQIKRKQIKKSAQFLLRDSQQVGDVYRTQRELSPLPNGEER